MSRTWKNSKNVEKPVRNRQKNRNSSKRSKTLKNHQICKKNGKKPSKISKNRLNCCKTEEKTFKKVKNQAKNH